MSIAREGAPAATALERSLDIHTHRLDAPPGSIVSLGAPCALPEPRPGVLYSVGVHPWDAAIPFDAEELRRLAASPLVAAIGEAGIDLLPHNGAEPAPLERQKEVFAWHAALAEEVGKPLVIHAVRSAAIIQQLRKELGAKQQWIIHGFRGKPEQALQLLRAGIDISLGEKFNPATARAVGAERLYAETDTSALTIEQVRQRIALALRS